MEMFPFEEEEEEVFCLWEQLFVRLRAPGLDYNVQTQESITHNIIMLLLLMSIILMFLLQFVICF